jgi:hypothetical protein
LSPAPPGICASRVQYCGSPPYWQLCGILLRWDMRIAAGRADLSNLTFGNAGL